MTYATIESTRRLAGECGIEHAARTYVPTFPGVHVCGGDHDENRVFTVLNLSADDDAQARRMWEAARAEAEDAGGEHELCVDLNTRDGHEDDFWTTRQMLPRLEAAARAARTNGGQSNG